MISQFFQKNEMGESRERKSGGKSGKKGSKKKKTLSHTSFLSLVLALSRARAASLSPLFLSLSYPSYLSRFSHLSCHLQKKKKKSPLRPSSPAAAAKQPREEAADAAARGRVSGLDPFEVPRSLLELPLGRGELFLDLLGD